MTKEELSFLEHKMTREEIIERAKTLRPVGDIKGKKYWLDVRKVGTVAFTFVQTPLTPTSYLRKLGSITTYHECGHPMLFKPSVDECVYQCPYPDAVAFMVDLQSVFYDNALNRHGAHTVYYAGIMPEEIKNRELEW